MPTWLGALDAGPRNMKDILEGIFVSGFTTYPT